MKEGVLLLGGTSGPGPCTWESYHTVGHVGGKVANSIPCKQYRERHLLHSPKTRGTCTKVPFGAFVPVCA